MKKAAARKSTRQKKRAPRVVRTLNHDFIRVVPLHQPKPVLSIDELSAQQQGELFDGKPRLAPPTARLAYRGGPLLTAVRVYTIFWGKRWNSDAALRPLREGVNQFFRDIVNGEPMDLMAEYSVPGKRIGRGSIAGTTTIVAGAPTRSITDTAIRAQLRAWLKAGTVPKATAQSLYFIYLEPGVVSIMGGSRSCQSYCGYHNNDGRLYYAVMPYPGCSGCLGGQSVLDALTATSSHELCEAVTDPVPGSGWYDDAHGEIGDICAWNFRRSGPHLVQLEWSNRAGRCV